MNVAPYTAGAVLGLAQLGKHPLAGVHDGDELVGVDVAVPGPELGIAGDGDHQALDRLAGGPWRGILCLSSWHQ